MLTLPLSWRCPYCSQNELSGELFLRAKYCVNWGWCHAAAFLTKGKNVTKEVYLDVLINVMKPWMKTVPSGKPYVCQVVWCKIGWRRHVLVRRMLVSQQPRFKSSGLLYVWSVVERITIKFRHPNVTLLRAAIEAAFANMDRDSLKRLRTLQIENGGDHSSRRILAPTM